MTPKAARIAKKKRILIIEDERPLAHALELKLTHEGHETVVASTGQIGFEQGLSGKFDLILLDLILPEMDGFTVLKELRAKKVKTPVIVLSNLGQEEDKHKAEDLGVAAYLVKSNAPLAEIVTLVQSVL
ncbi:MAG: sensory transduction protein [Candidatus Peregrinibacteria bacterium Gr01-1014_25]|nr:MAG: sensory transduction protein [Candidatus Peregrinibacteria bacterium Gr01-1014_25]